MRHPLARLAALLCIWLAGPRVVFAEETRAFFDVTVNGAEKGQLLAVIRGGDLLVPVDALTGAGIQTPAGVREEIGGESYISLASLAPRITYVLDERDLHLTLTVDPSLLERIVRDLQPGVPEGIEHRRATSGFVNYSLAAGAGAYEVFTESAISARGALWSTTASTTRGGTTRGLTSVTLDDRSRIRRWILGDSFVASGPLGGDAQIAGINVAREFSLAPYFVRYPTLSMSAPLQTESTVEVYVNGRMIRQEKVQAGQLDLKNFPLSTGHNQTRVVVRDPFGGTREMSTGYYLTTSVLAAGLQDYQYSLGWRRTGFGTRSFDYSAPVFLARHRIGLTNALTLGGRLEGDTTMQSGGANANVRLPIGEVELAAGASRAGGTIGTAAQAGYVFSGGRVSAGGSVRRADAAYAVVRSGARTTGTLDLNIFGGIPVAPGSSLTVQHNRSSGGIDGTVSRTGLVGSIRLGRNADVVASASRLVTATRQTTEMSIGVSLSFGGRTVSSVSTVRGPEGTRTAVDLQRSLSSGSGVGYQLHSESGGPQQLMSGAVQYQGSYGRYELRHDAVGATQHSSLNVSGALVGVGGRLYASRAVRNSFALVRVPGVNDVRTYSSNQEIGRTDRRGNLLVPDLLPYYGNQLRIADGDVPFEYVVSNTQVMLAPPFRGGAVVQFPVQRVQQASGKLVIASGESERVPVYGELTVTVAGVAIVSPIGRGGEFYFENLPAGRHAAVVSDTDGKCEFMMNVPLSTSAQVALGTIRCR